MRPALVRSTKLSGLILDPVGAVIRANNIKAAQFIYLLLEKREIRDVIDTTTAKDVAILSSSSSDRKPLLA